VVTRSIIGTGKLIKTGEGTLSFSPLFGGTTTFTGGTEVQDGRLQVTGASFPGNVNVSSNAVLEFTRGGAFRGVISGDGEVVKSGPTSLLLAGSNTYTGNTTIQQGLVITDGVNRLPSVGNVTVESGAELRLGGDQTLASVAGAGGLRIDTSLTTGSASSDFSGSVFGVGSLTKAGAGTFTLSGSNSFTGDTFVNGGRLVLGGSNALGGASVVKVNSGGTLEATQRVVIGFLDLDGGTVIGSNNLVSALTLINSGTVGGLADGPDFAAGILKRTAGLATVDGANTFTGTVKIDAGTVRMVSGGSFASASSLYVQNGGTLDLNGVEQTFSAFDGVDGASVTLGSGRLQVSGSAYSDFGGVISGTGSLVKSGAGTLTLGGANTYNGGTTLTGGRLVGNTTSLQGAITNTATVEFEQNSNATLGASVTGTGAFVKSGTGALSITNVQAYSGNTSLEQGQLIVDGSIAASTVTVEEGTTLGGRGTVGGLLVNSGGTVSPGSSPGNLTVAGNLVWNGGGNYNWQVLGTTATPGALAGTMWDLITVTGTLDLSAFSVGNEFKINLWSLSSTGPDTNGDIADFNPANNYEWLAVTASNITGFDASHFAVNVGAINDTTGFSNPLDPGYTFGVRQAGGNLYVTYGQAAPIPEPGTWAAMAIFAGGAAYAGWRRRKSAKISE
jgi:autotransporter-associated beta strand protein